MASPAFALLAAPSPLSSPIPSPTPSRRPPPIQFLHEHACDRNERRALAAVFRLTAGAVPKRDRVSIDSILAGFHQERFDILLALDALSRRHVVLIDRDSDETWVSLRKLPPTTTMTTTGAQG